MRIVSAMLASCLIFAGKGAFAQGASLESLPSKLLDRKVELALHVPSEAALQRWQAAHPGWKPRLVLFLPGAYDGPKDLIKQGIYADLAAREDAAAIPPSLWVAPEHFMSWYADRKDGSFPYERFLMEELIPWLEKAHPAFGGSREARTVAGLSMGGFGALNLAARTHAFARCAALSPALVKPPFTSAGFWLRPGLKKIFPLDSKAFEPWNPWAHLGGDAELAIGCGLQDRYGIAPAAQGLAERRAAEGHPAAVLLFWPGNHDWAFWTPAFERLAPWLAGGSVPPKLEP